MGDVEESEVRCHRLGVVELADDADALHILGQNFGFVPRVDQGRIAVSRPKCDEVIAVFGDYLEMTPTNALEALVHALIGGASKCVIRTGDDRQARVKLE